MSSRRRGLVRTPMAQYTPVTVMRSPGLARSTRSCCVGWQGRRGESVNQQKAAGGGADKPRMRRQAVAGRAVMLKSGSHPGPFPRHKSRLLPLLASPALPPKPPRPHLAGKHGDCVRRLALGDLVGVLLRRGRGKGAAPGLPAARAAAALRQPRQRPSSSSATNTNKAAWLWQRRQRQQRGGHMHARLHLDQLLVQKGRPVVHHLHRKLGLRVSSRGQQGEACVCVCKGRAGRVWAAGVLHSTCSLGGGAGGWLLQPRAARSARSVLPPGKLHTWQAALGHFEGSLTLPRSFQEISSWPHWVHANRARLQGRGGGGGARGVRLGCWTMAEHMVPSTPKELPSLPADVHHELPRRIPAEPTDQPSQRAQRTSGRG